MRSRLLRYWLSISLSLWLLAAQADVLVLVHGWSADADTWLHSGVMAGLERHGWQDAGVVSATPAAGIGFFPAHGHAATNRVYRVQLPAAAPLVIQAAHLFAELEWIRAQNPDAVMSLAGHSAGGLVARLVAIRPGSPPLTALITIASPNLGTSRALEGLAVVNNEPFFCPGPGMEFLKTMVGGDRYRYLRHSQGALVDLVPVAPGSLIDWLNHQPHPDMAYHAVVRNGPVYAGDELVPAVSQDLNQVPALAGRVQLYVTPTGHALNPADGELLARILDRN